MENQTIENNPNVATEENPVFNWKEMAFDAPKSVPLTEDNKAVSALPSFDINSSVPEDSIQNANSKDIFKGPNPQLDEVGERINDVGSNLTNFFNRIGLQASKAIFIAKNITPSVLTQIDQANFEAKNSENYPTKVEGENEKSYNKRLDDFYNSYRGEEISKGLGQLDKEMTGALAVAAPGMTFLHWGKLFGAMGLMEGEKSIQKKFAPDTPEGIKNLIDIGTMVGSFKASDKMIGGVSDFIADVLGKGGKSPTLDLLPDFVKNINDFDAGKLVELYAEPDITKRPAPFVKTSQSGWSEPDIKTPTGYVSGGTLEKLGVNEDHYNVSLNTNMPIRVPISTIILAAKDDPGINMKFDVAGWNNKGEENANQGGESTESGSGQEGVKGQAEAGVHLRDNAQGGMEAKEVEIPEFKNTGEAENFGKSNKGKEDVINKLSEQSDASKAKVKKMMDNFDNLTPSEEQELSNENTRGQFYREALAVAKGEREPLRDFQNKIEDKETKDKEKLTHDEANNQLPEDVKLSSTSGQEGQESNQTGLEGIKQSTVDEMQDLREKSGVPFTVTAGSEKGHATVDDKGNLLEFSHQNGDKFDIRSETRNAKTPEEKQNIEKLNKTIRSWEKLPNRKKVFLPLKEGETKAKIKKVDEEAFKNPETGSVYYKEGNHWDVEVKPAQEKNNETLNNKNDKSQSEKGTSKIAKSIETKAIENKLTTGFKDLAGFDKINVKEQAELGAKTVSNLDDARAMIRGEKPLPEGLRGISLITAMEEHLKANPDADIAYELANSPLVSETSKAAQELRLAAERTPDSATAKLAEIKKAKLESVGGEEKATKIKKDFVSKAQREINKMNLSKEDLNWDNFLDGIVC